MVGVAGPSGMDAGGWRRILLSHDIANPGEGLREAVAGMAKRQYTDCVTSNAHLNISPYLACHLIPIDNNKEG